MPETLEDETERDAWRTPEPKRQKNLKALAECRKTLEKVTQK